MRRFARAVFGPSFPYIAIEAVGGLVASSAAVLFLAMGWLVLAVAWWLVSVIAYTFAVGMVAYEYEEAY